MGIVGVAGVANEIDVRIPAAQRRTDPDIAFDALNALNAYLPLWSKNMTVTVDKGWITLEGKAEWSYQSERAEEVVCFVRGVEGVTNRIEVKPRMTLETAPSAWKGIGRA